MKKLIKTFTATNGDELIISFDWSVVDGIVSNTFGAVVYKANLNMKHFDITRLCEEQTIAFYIDQLITNEIINQ